MKFQHLPIGARFEFEGKVYVKTGPLAAASDQGDTRMIPRYATLKPLDGMAPIVTPPPGRKLDEAVVLAAFEAFHAECAALLDPATKNQLDEARARFRAALK